MMTESAAIDLLKSLSPEHQKQVIDLIVVLKDCEEVEAVSIVDTDGSWKTDPFFGMWADRSDVTDSSQWVRQLRKVQWNRS